MKFAIFWVFFNLIFSNFITPLLPENSLRFLIGMWMPAISAIVLLKIEKKSIKSGINWGLGTLRSYGYSVLIPILIATITVGLGLLSGKLSFNTTHSFPILGSILTLFIWFFSSLGEEIGWRGYLHNYFKRLKHFPLIVGVIWGFWHLRDLLSQGSTHIMLISFFSLTILISYFLSWLIEAGGTVIVCGLFHGVWNFLRLKLLFGNPAHGTTGFFITAEPTFTEMEGFFGLVATILVVLPFIILWYTRKVAVKNPFLVKKIS